MRRGTPALFGALALLLWPLAAHAKKLETLPTRCQVDRMAWEAFIEINLPAADSSSSSPTRWETWAHNPHTFPEDPDPWDPPPRSADYPFPGFDKSLKGRMIEIARNEESFAYIVSRCLWFEEGLARAFTAGNIEFPPGAIEIEASWKRIASDRRDSFHCKETGGVLYGLVGLHIKKKIGSGFGETGWLFATWEHKDNYGRCAEIGCKDRFGAVPRRVSPQFDPPEDQLTDKLLEKFERAGLPSVWKNYRLKGTQIDFAAEDGTPTLLGNSTMEILFTTAPSCPSCHARAAVDENGVALGYDIRSIGNPNRYWFVDPDGRRRFRQIDYHWSAGLHARPSVRSIDPMPPAAAERCDSRPQ